MTKNENSNNGIIYLDDFRDPGAETELSPIEMKQLDYLNLLIEIKSLEDSLEEDGVNLEKVKRQLTKLKSALKTIEFRIKVLKKDNDILAYIDEDVVVDHGNPKYIIKKGITDSSYEQIRKLKKRKTIFKEAKAAKSTTSRTLHATISSEKDILNNFQSQLEQFKKDEIFMKSSQAQEVEAFMDSMVAQEAEIFMKSSQDQKIEAFMKSLEARKAAKEDVKVVASATKGAFGHANSNDLSIAEKVKVFFSNILEKIKAPFRRN